MGQKIKAYDIEGREKEIDIDNIRFFGTEVEKTYYKNGKFKSFNTKTWIKVGSIKLYPEEWKISHLKKYFSKYDSSKKVIKESKDGKEKKATEWYCEVLEEGVISLNKEQRKTVKEAAEKRRMVNLKNKEFYHIFDYFFRDNAETNNYYYFNGEKLIDTKYNVKDRINEKTLEEWKEEKQ